MDIRWTLHRLAMSSWLEMIKANRWSVGLIPIYLKGMFMATVMSDGKWHVVKYENDILTTTRDGHRFEDFSISEEKDLVFADKHFGDHEHDSGTVITIPVNPELPKLNALLKAAIEFHKEYDWIT